MLEQVSQLEGYVESQSVSGGKAGSGRHRYANLSIRVPAEKVDGFVEEVSGLTNLVSSTRNVQDITLTYSDTEGRVTALETEAGLGNGETPIFPVQIFKVKEGVNYNPGDPNYDLFQQAMKTSAKRLFPNFSFLDFRGL